MEIMSSLMMLLYNKKLYLLNINKRITQCIVAAKAYTELSFHHE